MQNRAEIELRRRPREEYLPEWCEAKRLDPSGLGLALRSWAEPSPNDFLRAIDANVVMQLPDG
jgi:hypothetical protein